MNKIIENTNLLHNLSSISFKILKHIDISLEARLIEYNFAFKELENLSNKKDLLDLGSAENRIIKSLSNKFNVYATDVNPIQLDSNTNFVRCNIENLPFENNSFDVITGISTIEHVGLGRYGDPISRKGDENTFAEINRVLKPDGELIITIPFGRDMIFFSKDNIPLHRVYSSKSIRRILKNFTISKELFIIKKNGLWCFTSEEIAEKKVKNSEKEKAGLLSVALIKAVKEL